MQRVITVVQMTGNGRVINTVSRSRPCSKLRHVVGFGKRMNVFPDRKLTIIVLHTVTQRVAPDLWLNLVKAAVTLAKDPMDLCSSPQTERIDTKRSVEGPFSIKHHLPNRATFQYTFATQLPFLLSNLSWNPFPYKELSVERSLSTWRFCWSV